MVIIKIRTHFLCSAFQEIIDACIIRCFLELGTITQVRYPFVSKLVYKGRWKAKLMCAFFGLSELRGTQFRWSAGLHERMLESPF